MKDAPDAGRLLSDALAALEDPDLSGYARNKLANELRAQLEDAAPEVIQCPQWCERGAEHSGPDDTEHWTKTRHIDGGLYIDMSVDGGRQIFTIHAGDHVKLEFMAPDLARFIGALVELMAEMEMQFTKQVVLP